MTIRGLNHLTLAVADLDREEQPGEGHRAPVGRVAQNRREAEQPWSALRTPEGTVRRLRGGIRVGFRHDGMRFLRNAFRVKARYIRATAQLAAALMEMS